MQTFVRLRQILASHHELARKLQEMETKYDEQFKTVFEAIRALMTPLGRERKKIGFELKEDLGGYGKATKKRPR